MTWLGIIRDSTPVDPRPGVSELQFNTRMQVVNEMQVRWGYLSSAIAQQSGPILGIASANGATGNFLTFDLGSATQGFTGLGPTGIDILPPQPVGPKRRKPVVIAGNPVAPVINFVTPSPTSPPATYIIGVVTFTANVTYDGLSGPLAYAWSTPISGGILQPVVIVNNANPGSFNFDVTCTPGNYSYTLTVTPLGNPLLFATLPTSYTVL